MPSRFFTKRPLSAADATEKAEVPVSKGLEVKEDDPETAWGLWDEALASQATQPVPLPDISQEQAPPSTAHPIDARPIDAHPSGFNARAGLDVAEDEEPATLAMPLDELSPEQRKNDALAIVEAHHSRIANTIRTLWGYPECSAYINKLIMSGGDGMGHSRVGFHQVAVDAMLELANLHDAEFGAPPSSAMSLD